MHWKIQAACGRLTAILQALLVLAEADGEADGRALHPETQRGYEHVLQIAEQAGLLTERERAILQGVIVGWGHEPPVVRELLTCFISEIIGVTRGSGLPAVVEWLRAQREVR